MPHPHRAHPPAKNRKKPWLIVLGIVVALVLLAHLLLPSLILRLINRSLEGIPGYRAHIEDIDISLLRGAYTIQDFSLKKIEGNISVPIVTVEATDLSVEWKALFQGKIVGEIVLTRPRLNFVAGINEEQSQTGIDEWQKAIQDLFPITINRFEIIDGAIHYQDLREKPQVDLKLDRIRAVATGLTNAQETDSPLPAAFHATARAMDHAPLKIGLAMAPLADNPTFDLNAELTDLNLPTLNDFFKAYANVDVEKGTLSLFTETAASEGRFQGYVKPLLRDMQVLSLEGDDENPLRMAWEALAGAVSEIFENQAEEQVGTRIPFSGRFSNPDADVWSTVGFLLRNAFVRALSPGLEGSIRFEGGPDKEEEKQQKKKEAEKS
jgi:hypothetical protein